MLPALSLIAIDEPVEDYAPRDPPQVCKKDARPGVLKFREFVLREMGGGNSGIERGCGPSGATSHHNEGRAWDWTVDADVAEDRSRVERLLAWLMSPGSHGEPHEMLRRAGIRYIVWDRQIWTTGTKAWEAYGPSGNKTIEHRDHVHFSFATPGADGKTSFFRWLNREQPVVPPAVPLKQPSQVLPVALGVVIGFAAISLAWTRLPRMR